MKAKETPDKDFSSYSVDLNSFTYRCYFWSQLVTATFFLVVVGVVVVVVPCARLLESLPLGLT